jgi:hypothetical protein
MENKKDELKDLDLTKGFNAKSDDWSWIIGMALIMGLFSDKDGNSKSIETESRLAKLETKTDMIEKILLK